MPMVALNSLNIAKMLFHLGNWEFFTSKVYNFYSSAFKCTYLELSSLSSAFFVFCFDLIYIFKDYMLMGSDQKASGYKWIDR